MDKLNETSYSQVIFKTKNDREAKDLLNSFKFKVHQFQHRKWSPEISKEDRFKLKRKREDEYVFHLDEDQRPILMIKKKEAYEGLSPHEGHEANREKYYKISENTNVIEDIKKEIKEEQPLLRKETVNYKFQSKNAQENNQIYKFQGVEYLPEGFLELDPLLYKDQY